MTNFGDKIPKYTFSAKSTPKVVGMGFTISAIKSIICFKFGYHMVVHVYRTQDNDCLQSDYLVLFVSLINLTVHDETNVKSHIANSC